MSFLNSEFALNGSFSKPNPILECASRIVGLARDGQIDISRRIGEGSLTAQLSTSRATVRSALDHLELTGLVKRIPRAGTFLTPVGPKEFCQVMDIRAALEALAARQAASHAHPSTIVKLRELAAEVDSLNRRYIEGENSALTELSSRDSAFHFAITRLSGNDRLALTLAQQRLIEQSFSLDKDTSMLYSRHDRPVPTHMEIVEAIASRDPAVADETVRQHILRTKELRLGTFTGEMA